ncbi:protein of unknown function [Rhizobium sp. RU35A]|uniref:DUF4189 domain-containing protein n=1 Tax=Rhizobium sp. RU35A TaxID=1907414 RepID=UPI00095695D1|nr:DUF4189 domain-containing protein [Rhizobium sp. RU35A]SIR41858.1 protein of unknown function [Rhizobium sp. RU35A]
MPEHPPQQDQVPDLSFGSIFATSQFESRDEVTRLLEEMAQAVPNPNDNAGLQARRRIRARRVKWACAAVLVAILALAGGAVASGIIRLPGSPITVSTITNAVDRARVQSIIGSLDGREAIIVKAEEKLRIDRGALDQQISSVRADQQRIATQQADLERQKRTLADAQSALSREKTELQVGQQRLTADQAALAKAKTDLETARLTFGQPIQAPTVSGSYNQPEVQPQPPVRARFVAMAIDRGADIAVGWGEDLRSATQEALRDCSRLSGGDRCKIAISASDCISIARGGINGWGTGRGPNKNAAAQAAIRACSRTGLFECTAARQETYCP